MRQTSRAIGTAQTIRAMTIDGALHFGNNRRPACYALEIDLGCCNLLILNWIFL